MQLNPNPSYGTGFARSKAESAFPGMWDGLIGAWPFYLGPTGSVRDATGNKNDGTFEAGALWDRNSVSLDASDDYIDIGDQDLLSLDGASEMSVIAHIYQNDFSHGDVRWGGLANKGGIDLGGVGWELLSRNDTNFLLFSAADAVGGALRANVLTAKKWESVAGVFKNSSANLYLNGQFLDDEGTDPTIVDSALPVWIGRRNDGNAFQGTLDGRIDSVLVYARALAVNELLEHTAYPKGLLTLGRRATYFVPTLPIHNRAAFTEGDRL